MSGPVLAVWELTLQCNLGCRHCGSRAGASRPDELTTAEALDVVEQLAEAGVGEVSLIGGEAYLREDWDVIARAIADRGMYCSMVTGGRGLDPALARRAARARIGNVCLSIDGLETTHDAIRGWRGSYRAALDALAHLREAGVETSVTTQIHRGSAPELEALLEAIAAEGVRNWKVQLTVPMGRAADRPEILLQPYELGELFPRLARIKVRCIELGVAFFPGNNIGYFGPYEVLLRGDSCETGHWSGCTAGDQTLGIEADGTLKGCPGLPPAYAGGNLRRRRLREILEEPPLRAVRDRTVDDLWGFCRTCYYADVCRAGCTWTAHVVFGRPGNNPYCHHRVLELEGRGLRERIVRTAPAAGRPFDHGLFELVLEPIPREAP